VGPAYTGVLVSLAFQAEGSRHVLGVAWSFEFLCVPGSRTYHWIMEPGAAWWLQEQGIRSVELQVILPILPMVSCISICVFGEGYASCWLWDLVSGCLLGPLIFLFWDNWSLLGCKNGNNLPFCPALPLMWFWFAFLLWILTISIFSYTHWSFVCLLFRTIYYDQLSTLKSDY
jgi:hypothetical protein